MMGFLLLLLTLAHIEPVKLQDETLILQSEQPCEGHVEIYRNNKWGYLGWKNWNESIEEVVCRSTHCGTPLKNSTGYKLLPPDSKVWLDNVRCSGKEERLWDCKYPEWEINNREQTIKTVKCSDQTILTLDGYYCAGAVKYSKIGISGYICDENWGQNEANLVCQSLGCGEDGQIPEKEWFGGTSFQGSTNMKIKCSDIAHLKNLWQCVDQESKDCQKPASVICKDSKRMQLKGDGSNVCSGRLEKEENQQWTPVTDNKISPEVLCRQMHCGDSNSNSTIIDNEVNVTCSDNVKIVLKDKNNKDSKCYGVVHTEVNGKSFPVCASSWTKVEAEVVCQEMNCGNVIVDSKKSNSLNGIMDHVQCSGTESSLWHCMARHYDKPFKCQTAAYVICARSINVTLKDGLGKCDGRVEIEYEGQWKRANKKTWKPYNSDVVCKYLDCGGAGVDDSGNLYSPGSGGFLDVECKSKKSHISECITGNPKSGLEEAVGITCEKHKVVFLDGDRSCSGLVGIEQNSGIFWLSGSNWTKEVADTVCQQMHCEEAHNFTSIPKTTEEVWDESYICPSNSTSLSECETIRPSSKTSIARVWCRGTISVSLTAECWGNISICMNKTCSSVCSDTWTDKKSNMVCNSLQCGHALQNPKGLLRSSSVSFKSVHTPKHIKDLSQSNFVKSDEKDTCKQKAAVVVCSGSVDVRIGHTSEHCSGKVEVLYAGNWLPVCKTALADNQTKNMICEKIQCGQAVNELHFYGPTSGGHSISKIQCAGDVKSCNVTSDLTTCDPVGLQCSSYRKMELETGTACSGALLVHSGEREERSAVSEDGWTETEGNRLCQDLKCGEFVSKHPIKPITDSFWNSSFTCKDNPQSIWDCENQTASKRTNQLFIKCRDEREVSLSERCGGQVTMNNTRLSNTHWSMNYSDLVCYEMNCGKAVGTDLAPQSKETRYNVQCAEYHSKLGRCKSFKAEQEARSVSVYCVDRVQFGTTEKNGGQLLVNYRNKWEKVCFSTPLSLEYKTKLCEELKKADIHVLTDISAPVTTFSCDKGQNDLRYCVRQGNCAGINPATISCRDTETTPPPTTDPPNMVVIILGSLILLVLVIVAFVFVRNFIVRRSKRASNVKANMFLRNAEEPESGDYEDIIGTRPGMDNFSEGEFRPEASFIKERDARSTSSFPYDDVDEDQLLTASQATFTVSSRNNQNPAGTPTLRADQEAIEMDEPRRSYSENDSPEITEAEVHDEDHIRQADFPAPPVEPLPEVEDYLEPDQNG